MKTYGYIILIAVICIVIFWVLMALRPAQAQTYYFCGSSWAICKYRAHWRAHGYHSPEYQRVQQRISRNCNPATVWKDACR
jgi:hypothetical protein